MRFGISFPTLGPAERDAAAYYDDCLKLAERADVAGFASLKAVELRSVGWFEPDDLEHGREVDGVEGAQHRAGTSVAVSSSRSRQGCRHCRIAVPARAR